MELMFILCIGSVLLFIASGLYALYYRYRCSICNSAGENTIECPAVMKSTSTSVTTSNTDYSFHALVILAFATMFASCALYAKLQIDSAIHDMSGITSIVEDIHDIKISIVENLESIQTSINTVTPIFGALYSIDSQQIQLTGMNVLAQLQQYQKEMNQTIYNINNFIKLSQTQFKTPINLNSDDHSSSVPIIHSDSSSETDNRSDDISSVENIALP